MNRWSGFALLAAIAFTGLTLRALLFDQFANIIGHVYNEGMGINQIIEIMVWGFMSAYAWATFCDLYDWKD